MAGLKNLAGYVRKHVADNVRLRLCPEIRFIRDDSIERGEQVMALLERIKLQAAGGTIEEDGFLDLSEEDELVGEHDVLSDVAASRDGDGNQGQTGKATPQRNSIRRKVAQPGDGFFGFEEPGPLTWEEASLPLGRVQPVSEETGRRKRRPR
eukprot:jgi/Botrbrau1/15138/Bobra.0149s0010.1